MGEEILAGIVIALVAALLGGATATIRSSNKGAELAVQLAAITGRLETVSAEFTNLDKDVAAMLPIAASVTRIEERVKNIEKDLDRAWERIHSWESD